MWGLGIAWPHCRCLHPATWLPCTCSVLQLIMGCIEPPPIGNPICGECCCELPKQDGPACPARPGAAGVTLRLCLALVTANYVCRRGD